MLRQVNRFQGKLSRGRVRAPIVPIVSIVLVIPVSIMPKNTAIRAFNVHDCDYSWTPFTTAFGKKKKKSIEKGVLLHYATNSFRCF